MNKVFVGIGHGGSDPGAVANGLKESEVALTIGLETARILTDNGVVVGFSRTTDEDDPLICKIDNCNKFNPDLAVDIHINAGGGKGFEAFYYHKGGKSLTLAKTIEAEVIAIGQQSRGLKTKLDKNGNDYFGWIREVSAPSVILEAAFIDNLDDVEMIRSIEARKQFGKAYAYGILKTLGIKPKEVDTMDKVYKTVEDIPAYGKATVEKLIRLGALRGDADGNLNIPDQILRSYVVNDRAGAYKE